MMLISCSDDISSAFPDGSDIPKKHRATLKLAIAGDAKAQLKIANLYANGADGVIVSAEKSIPWMTAAANQGIKIAEYNLGSLYISLAKQGKGNNYYDDGVEWYLKSATSGYHSAQHKLGTLYLSGEAVDQDKKESFKWFKKAAENGEVNSMFEMGLFYRRGDVIKKDNVKAYQWIKLSLYTPRKPGSNNETTDYRTIEFMSLKSKLKKSEIKKADRWVKKKLKASTS
jgi:TPR repeat protein